MMFLFLSTPTLNSFPIFAFCFRKYRRRNWANNQKHTTQSTKHLMKGYSDKLQKFKTKPNKSPTHPSIRPNSPQQFSTVILVPHTFFIVDSASYLSFRFRYCLFRPPSDDRAEIKKEVFGSAGRKKKKSVEKAVLIFFYYIFPSLLRRMKYCPSYLRRWAMTVKEEASMLYAHACIR